MVALCIVFSVMFLFALITNFVFCYLGGYCCYQKPMAITGMHEVSMSPCSTLSDNALRQFDSNCNTPDKRRHDTGKTQQDIPIK
jgi:hypothetical protein